MKNLDKEKKRFEEWVKKEADWCLDWRGNDLYDYDKTVEAWAMWQSMAKSFTLKTWFLRKIENLLSKKDKK